MRNSAGLHHENTMRRFPLIRRLQATLLGLFVLSQGFSQAVAQGGTDLTISNLTVSGKNSSSVSLTWSITQQTNIAFRIEWLNYNVPNIPNTSYTITGLTAGWNYTFKVTAVRANNTEGPSAQIFTFTNPNAVNNLNVSVQTTSVSLTWSEPQGNWSLFTVEWPNGIQPKKDNTSNTSYTISNLTAGGKYTFKVTAVAADRETVGPTTQLITFTNPDAVTNLNILNKTTSSVSLTWNVPQGNWSSFTVEWTDGLMGSAQRKDILGTSYTITNLTAGVNYTFKVTAIAADGKTAGAPAQDSAFTIPDVVTNLNIHNISTSSVSLTWNVPQGNWSSFTVEWIDGLNGGVKNTTNITGTSYKITDLTAGVNYTFKVTAIAADGKTAGAPAQNSTFTNPNGVTSFAVSERNTSSVTLTWNETLGNRAYFTVELNSSIVCNITIKSCTVTNLTAGVKCTFKITAVAGDGRTKGASTEITSYTRPNVVTNLKVSQKNTSYVSLTWNEPAGSRAYFTVKLNSDIKCNSTNMSCTVTGLSAGGNYTFTVTAFAGDGTEGTPIQISSFTVPNVVTNLTVSQTNTSSVSLTWEPVGSRAYFTVKLNSDIKCNSTNMSCTVTGLSAGGYYTFTVTAFAGDGTAGTPVQISSFTKPDVVTNLKVSEKNTSSVSLIWNKPQGNWSLFRVEWIDGSTLKKDNSSTTSYTVTGLTSGRSYTFKVIVIAADNQTEGAPAEIVASAELSPVSDLNVTKITTTSVTLIWNYPDKSVHNFNISWNDGTNTTNETSYLVTNLTSGKNYSFTVTAVAENETSEPNIIAAFTKPEVVTNLQVSEKNTSSVTLTWTAPVGCWSSFRVQWTNGITMSKGSCNTPNNSNTITGLEAAVNYTFTVTAVAGDGNTEGEPTSTSNFTKPVAVTGLSISKVNTSSVFLTWNKQNGSVSFRVQWNNGTMYYNVSTENTYTVNGLIPGTNYTFSVTAVAGDGETEGESASNTTFTKPDIVGNLDAFKVNASSVSLNWTKPTGKHSFYMVKWENQINASFSETTNLNSLDIFNLIPGTNYKFEVRAVAGDNTTEGNPVQLDKCTDTSRVSEYNCSPIDGIAAVHFSWTVPEGNNQGFNIALNQLAPVFVECSSGCNHTFNKLQFYQLYNLNISTLGCGRSGISGFQCQTGIGAPPVPETWNITIISKNQKEITLSFSSSLLNNINGPVEAYGVLLSTDPNDNNFTSGITKHYNDWKNDKTKTYLTVLKYTTRLTRNGFIQITIGSEDSSDVINGTDYINGRLKSGQIYRAALVLFTKLKLNNKLVDVKTSIYAASGYSQEPMSPEPETNLGLILGVVFAILALIIVAAVLFVWQKRRANKTYTDIPFDNVRTKVSIPVRVEDHEAYFRKQQSDSNCGFAEEYEDLKVVGTAQTKNSALAIENKGKNRYNNVLPYDSSRVKLSIHGSPFDDYINANYLAGYNSKKEYVAAQGPLPTTVNEFWRMIWEKNVHTLVMLTKCYEQGRVKCEKYWPSESTLYNNIAVTTASEISLDDWTIRDFSIRNVKTAETREVRQFHFTAWPDHGVPETTEVLINFRHLVREHMDNYSRNSPTVVHCSAGVGRTGTFIALDHLIFQIERESMVDIYGIVHNMRMHRPLMVQTEDQYVFLNQCAFDIIKSRTGTNVDLIYQNAAAFSIYENV